MTCTLVDKLFPLALQTFAEERGTPTLTLRPGAWGEPLMWPKAPSLPAEEKGLEGRGRCLGLTAMILGDPKAHLSVRTRQEESPPSL